MNQKKTLNRVWQLSLALIAIVLIGVLCRLEMTGLPNVKPLAAMALWAAFCFRSVWFPALALLVVMGTTDIVLGSYEWPILVSVYVSMIVSCGLGVWVRNRVDQKITDPSWQTAGPSMIAASLVMSTCFYLLTNGMVWACGWYPPTITGLIDCYLAAIPFYRFTLVGDLIFTATGLLVWQLVGHMVKAKESMVQVNPTVSCEL